MIKIPQTGKVSVQNKSDLFGDLWYTKNINLDEEGYIKLSSRSVMVKSEEDTSTFDLLVGVGTDGSGSGLIATTDEPFTFSINGTVTFSVTEDTGTDNPNLTFDSWGCWWQARWHTSFSTQVSYKSAGTWTPSVLGTALTSGNPHPMCVFTNRNTLAIGDGNLVRQYSTTYVAGTSLTVPSDYEVVAMAYNNNRLGILTRFTSAAEGQNTDAYFFVWDGGTTAANEGVPIGSDCGVSIVAYKNTWLIITRTGQVLQYQSGGFTPLVNFPNYYNGVLFGDNLNKVVYGQGGCVDGDVVYFNLDTQLDQDNTKPDFLQNLPSGVWCFDPAVGFYNRHLPSVSPISINDATACDTSTNIFTGDSCQTGDLMRYNGSSSGAATVGGVTLGNYYYAIRLSSTTYKLATTYANALAGTAIDITSFSGTTYFTQVNLVDYGSSRGTSRCGGVYNLGGTDYNFDHLMYGGDYDDYDNTNKPAMACITIPGLESRGFFVTSKIKAPQVTDVNQKVYIKHRPLKLNDSIVVKYKDTEIVGLPTLTSKNTSQYANWTSSTVFTTTTDLSVAKTYIDTGNELECELVSGYGGGMNIVISSITESSGTYTVTLATTVLQATTGYYSNFIIDNWKSVGTVTYSTQNGENYAEFPIGKVSKDIKFKVELIGTEVTIEELQLINTTHKPSV